MEITASSLPDHWQPGGPVLVQFTASPPYNLLRARLRPSSRRAVTPDDAPTPRRSFTGWVGIAWGMEK